MEQRPSWEANRPSASQKILRILWKLKIYNRIHNIQPPVPTLSQTHLLHALIPLLEDSF
jgi:hypothetical protein